MYIVETHKEHKLYFIKDNFDWIHHKMQMKKIKIKYKNIYIYCTSPIPIPKKKIEWRKKKKKIIQEVEILRC